jgi:hypothetical protein
MGIFKDLHQVSKQGKALGAQSDVGAQLQRGMDSMAQATHHMAEQTAGAQLAVTGTPAQLQVTAARDSGTVVNMQPVVELDLLIHPESGPPYPTTVRQTVPLASAGRVVPGAMLSGRVDRSAPTSVWIDWTA